MQLSEPVQNLLVEHVANKADLLIAVLTSDGTIEQVNKRVEMLAGASPVGKNFEDLIIDFQGTFSLTDITDTDSIHLLNVIKTTGLPLTYYFRFIRCEDKIVAVGQQDSEEIDAMRRDLLELNNELNNLTRELHKKNVTLEKLNAMQNQFFGMASHDLRHPLGVISMYSSFLKTDTKESLNPTHQEFLDYIVQSSSLMENILNDFLDFSIFESGRFSLHCTNYDLNIFLEKIVNYTTEVARNKDITVNFTKASKPIAIHMDGAKIEQVINNLTSNAMKASPKGSEIKIHLFTEGEEAVVQIIDTGVGIEQALHEKIFEPFNTLHTGKSAEEKSSGLGLAIVKKIVAAHGGKVGVESEVGKGATFWFSLPC